MAFSATQVGPGKWQVIMSDGRKAIVDSAAMPTEMDILGFKPQVDYKALAQKMASEFGVDPNIAIKLMATESSNDPNAVSSKGAQGLMQLMPATAAQYGMDPTIPEQNIEGGLRHLKYLQDKYKGNMVLALAAYNAGEGAVDQAGGVPNFPETQNYVQKILGEGTLAQGGQVATQPPPAAGSNNAPITVERNNETPRDPNYTGTGPYGTGWNPSNVLGSAANQLKAGFDSAKETAMDPNNWPMILGMLAGGSAASSGPMSLMPSTIRQFLAAGGGGAVGEGLREVSQGQSNIDPNQILRQFLTQGALEAAPHAAGGEMKRVGAAAYTRGAGLNRPGFSQNFPTAAQEGLEGGRMSMPIITAGGAQRVLDREAPKPNAMIQAAQAKGVTGATPVQVARTGVTPVLKEVQQGAILPQSERRSVIDLVKQFIEQHSTVTPARTVQQPTGATGNNGRSITQSVTLPRRVQPNVLSLEELQKLKTGSANRSQATMRSMNADKFPATTAQTERGISIGAQKILEEKVPGLADQNRKVQGQIGLNQSLNPSFRTPEELMKMGVDPQIASTMSSNANSWTLPRMLGELGGAGLAGTIGMTEGAVPGLLTMAGVHALMSPVGQRTIGAGMYTGGRALPNTVRAGRFGAAAASDETEIERSAILKALLGR